MQKDQSYHESAIAYNEGLAEFAENLVPRLEHEEVKRWCTAVGKQHRFHAKRHRSALEKFLRKEAAPPVEMVRDGMDVPDPSEENEPEVILGKAELRPTSELTEVEDILEPETAVETLSDGCSPYHDPTNPACEFYPQSGNSDDR